MAQFLELASNGVVWGYRELRRFEFYGWVLGTEFATVDVGLRLVKGDENRSAPQYGRERRDRTNQWSC
jgi:hypothetical protein